MSTYADPSIAELETQMSELQAHVNKKLSSCDKLIVKIGSRHSRDDNGCKKAESLLAEHKVTIIAPHIAIDAAKLPTIELKLKVAEYKLKKKAEECKRLEAKHLEALKVEICVQKEKKQLSKTVAILTADLEGRITPEDKTIKIEHEQLKEELAMLRSQLKSKTVECEAKDTAITELNKDREAKDVIIASNKQDIADLRDDFAAYESLTSGKWFRRHDSCNELAAALEEQCRMLASERDTLKANIDTFEGSFSALECNLNTDHQKLNSVMFERGNLPGRFDNATKAHQIEVEDYDSLECDGLSSCNSRMMYLERALRISQAAEAQALQLVDQVNHDRMVAWNQLHEYQTRVVQEHYAATSSWVSERQLPSPSSTLVSPTLAPGEIGKTIEIWHFPEDGSVKII